MSTSPQHEIGVGVIGLGVMGATHVRAINVVAARRGLSGQTDGCVRLAAVCDRDDRRRTGIVSEQGNMSSLSTHEQLFAPATTAAYADPGDLLRDPNVRAVHICTHTDTHVDLAVRAIEAGKHVLIEKPVAIASADVRRVMMAAEGKQTVCMPAMCMRFWPGWPWLRGLIRSGEYGHVRSAVFQRVGTPPSWSAGFYGDSDRSGGALIDLHIHDADFILWCFGMPAQVVSAGSLNHLTTLYRFPESAAVGAPGHVVAEGGWGHAPGFGFRMRYTVAFERATAEFDLGRTPSVMLYREGRGEPVEVPSESAYQIEIDHFLGLVQERERVIRGGSKSPGGELPKMLGDGTPTLQDALAAATLLEAERRSLATGHAQSIVWG